MLRLRNLIKTIGSGNTAFQAYAWLVLIVPLLVLTGFGIYFLFEASWLLWFFLAYTLVVASVLGLILLKRKFSSEDASQDVPQDIVQPSPGWGDNDLKAWRITEKHIDLYLDREESWSSILFEVLPIAQLVALQYDKNELDISSIEALVLLEEVSRRYRKILRSHVPFVEKIKISYIKFGVDNRKTTGKVWNVLSNVIRVVRLANPASAMMSEVRLMIQDQLFEHLSKGVQHKLKRALLQEIASVTIDLYSGRYQFVDEELGVSLAKTEDDERLAQPLEPLRIVLIGQISSGKSSLINAMTGKIAAEVSVTPVTDRVTAHHCSLMDEEVIRLIDLPGIDGTPKTDELIIQQALEADLVLWILKANQPARDPDVLLLGKLNDYYLQNKNGSLRKPPIIAVLNQIDSLLPESVDIQEVNLSELSDPRLTVIKEAIEYNEEIFAADEIIPVCVSEIDYPVNVEYLANLIDQYLELGKNVQLNRKRIDTVSNQKLTSHIGRLKKSGVSLVKLLKSNVTMQ